VAKNAAKKITAAGGAIRKATTARRSTAR
jgi:hypothetical protein